MTTFVQNKTISVKRYQRPTLQSSELRDALNHKYRDGIACISNLGTFKKMGLISLQSCQRMKETLGTGAISILDIFKSKENVPEYNLGTFPGIIKESGLSEEI